MKVDIYSRKAIEELIENDFPENVAVISFYDPPGKYKNAEPPVDYKGKAKKLFQVAVYDIDIEVLADFSLTFDTYFTEVDELAEFVMTSYREGLDIICQCEYGQSRSAACAAAILEYFEGNGILVFKYYRYYPNQLIFNKVYDALNLLGTNLIKSYRYENLIVTHHNRVAKTASLEVAQYPGQAYNPLYIYGSTGVGKTYILHAMGNYIVENHPEKKVHYTTGQRIVEDIIETIKKRDTNMKELRDKYSTIDVLLVDDIQFMKGKESTQMEFLNIVKTMCECGKQVIVSCDSNIKYNEALHNRMQSFFASGLVVQIKLPDLVARKAFLLKCIEKQCGEDIVSMEVVDYVSKNMETNYYVLNGVMQKIIAKSKASGGPIDILSVKEMINDITV